MSKGDKPLICTESWLPFCQPLRLDKGHESQKFIFYGHDWKVQKGGGFKYLFDPTPEDIKLMEEYNVGLRKFKAWQKQMFAKIFGEDQV